MVLFIARGEASNVVIVVLNIAVNAAREISIQNSDPKFVVYNAISC